MRMGGKIGLVTAAGSGIGRAGAIRFAKEGASVGVVDIDADAVAAVVAEIEAGGGKALGITADLSKDEDSRRIVRNTVNHFNGLDFVWNHVGHPGPAVVEGLDSALGLPMPARPSTTLGMSLPCLPMPWPPLACTAPEKPLISLRLLL